MAGNMAVWVNDEDGSDYYRDSPLKDPPSPEIGIDNRGFRCAR
ncbi:MAG: hypothetical protein WCI88_15085 [Chloroflexota bacterium]